MFLVCMSVHQQVPRGLWSWSFPGGGGAFTLVRPVTGGGGGATVRPVARGISLRQGVPPRPQEYPTDRTVGFPGQLRRGWYASCGHTDYLLVFLIVFNKKTKGREIDEDNKWFYGAREAWIRNVNLEFTLS